MSMKLQTPVLPMQKNKRLRELNFFAVIGEFFYPRFSDNISSKKLAYTVPKTRGEKLGSVPNFSVRDCQGFNFTLTPFFL
jgi:hypothetical protein